MTFSWAATATSISYRRVRNGGELMLVDSRSSPAEAREVLSDLSQFAPAAVRVP
jgi:hypothetical protein